MPIKLFDKKEDVPADQRDKAIETKEGKFAIEEVDPKAISPAAQQALDKERKAKEDAESARKAAEKERDDLKRAQEARDKGVPEAEIQKIKDAEAAARKPIEDENARLKAENDKLKRTDKVRALALAHGVLPDRIEDAMVLLDSRTRLGDQGNIIVRDKNGTDTTESPEDFIAKTFKKEKPYLYKGPGGSGGGADAGSEGGGSDYDPAAAGKKAGQAQKAQTAADASLAWK